MDVDFHSTLSIAKSQPFLDDDDEPEIEYSNCTDLFTLLIHYALEYFEKTKRNRDNLPITGEIAEAMLNCLNVDPSQYIQVCIALMQLTHASDDACAICIEAEILGKICRLEIDVTQKASILTQIAANIIAHNRYISVAFVKEILSSIPIIIHHADFACSFKELHSHRSLQFLVSVNAWEIAENLRFAMEHKMVTIEITEAINEFYEIFMQYQDGDERLKFDNLIAQYFLEHYYSNDNPSVWAVEEVKIQSSLAVLMSQVCHCKDTVPNHISAQDFVVKARGLIETLVCREPDESDPIDYRIPRDDLLIYENGATAFLWAASQIIEQNEDMTAFIKDFQSTSYECERRTSPLKESIYKWITFIINFLDQHGKLHLICEGSSINHTNWFIGN